MASRLRLFGTEISGNRQTRHNLPPTTRSAIVAAYVAGGTKAQVARAFKVHRHTVDYTLNRWHNHHQWESLPKSGRPESLNPRQKRLVFRIARKDPKIKWRSIRNQLPFHTSLRTLQRMLWRKFELRKWRSLRRPSLSEEDAKSLLTLKPGVVVNQSSWKPLSTVAIVVYKITLTEVQATSFATVIRDSGRISLTSVNRLQILDLWCTPVYTRALVEKAPLSL